MTDRTGQQLGNYHLLRLLGSGGFATVYLSEHIHLKSLAAIKILYTHLTEDLQDNFLNEARILARFSHTGIIRLLDFGIDEGVPFLVMEYAPHGTLRRLHPHTAKLPLIMVVNYINQIADGLQYAHDQKLIHRDLKPDNILIGQRGNLLLSDFGVALIAQTTNSHNPEVNFAGTVAYMAPEQLQGMPQFASDQYALGIMTYEWLCGTRPFQGTVIELYNQHVSIPPKPLHKHMPDLPVEVEQVVLKALSKDPGERFPNVKAYAAALEQASQSMQVVPALHTNSLPASLLINSSISPASPQNNASAINLTTSQDHLISQTSSPLPQQSTSSLANLPISQTGPSTSSHGLLPADSLLPTPERSMPPQAPLPPFVQPQELIAPSPISQQSHAEIQHVRKKLSKKATAPLIALVLFIILLVVSTTLSTFNPGDHRAVGNAAANRTMTQGNGNATLLSRGTNIPGSTPSSKNISSPNGTPGRASSPNAIVPTPGVSSSTGGNTPAAQSIAITQSTSGQVSTPTSAPLPTPTPKPPTPTPTPTPAGQGCTTYNWTISSATGPQTGSFTTSTNCNTIKVTLRGGLLTRITIQACTSSGCGPSQLALLNNTIMLSLPGNVPAGTSFYLKTTSVLLLNDTLSGIVSC